MAASELWARDNKALIKENVSSDVENGYGGHFAAARAELFKDVDEDIRDHYEKLSGAPPSDVDVDKAMERCVRQLAYTACAY